MYMYAKYEVSICYGSKFMPNIIVGFFFFVIDKMKADKQIRRIMIPLLATTLTLK